MRVVSVRLLVPAFVAMVAALALTMAGTASAADVLQQCSGVEKVEYEGSTFQAPIDFFWTGKNSEKENELTGTGFNVSAASSACSGTQGSKAKPEVYYNQSNSFDREAAAASKHLAKASNHSAKTKAAKPTRG